MIASRSCSDPLSLGDADPGGLRLRVYLTGGLESIPPNPASRRRLQLTDHHLGVGQVLVELLHLHLGGDQLLLRGDENRKLSLIGLEGTRRGGGAITAC